jgi:hypothetical protein
MVASSASRPDDELPDTTHAIGRFLFVTFAVICASFARASYIKCERICGDIVSLLDDTLAAHQSISERGCL